ncbi:uncharacterized protein LOC116801143 [Drosophila sechellia]|uniref:Uncharacterized protein n=2 Tax=melanogaster subgroup TaxID=32351 RepID=A0A0J9RV53_DROSI|nr:uncharacterized protein LOC116801143 [Drosophila sechellia]XP_033159718.1 uncharacterized protein LOC117140745 [Drosophila mauritiana]XP_039150328.1 uncharacterized protein LOC27207839 [Drosophila simulans]KMY99462.1 uncharacterized protein Dsimw501_GD27990 [Drosophila simulans]
MTNTVSVSTNENSPVGQNIGAIKNTMSPTEISIQQLPNLASNWSTFLRDITNDRKLRAERINRQSENVIQFINRFPLLESS